MANDESVPELEKILEHNFAEMKIGEDKFQQNEPAKQKISEVKKIIYQERYSSENQTGTITVKPIKATKDIINAPCLLYTSPSPRDKRQSRMPSSA